MTVRSLYSIVLGALMLSCGRLGFNATSTNSTDAAADSNNNGDAATGPTSVTVAASDSHTCAIRRGQLACWGSNSDGQLGTGDQVQRLTPTAVSGDNWAEVRLGGAFTCARKTNGDVYAWGSNSTGQLGALAPAASSVPLRIALPAAARAITGGETHACAILENGQLWCWGDNVEGQLGLADNGSEVSQALPTTVIVNQNWTALTASQGNTLALAGTTLFGTGRNTSGELGSSAGAGQYRTLSTFSDLSFADIIAGSNHTLAIDSQARLLAWGSNNNAQLGTGDRVAVLAPQIVEDNQTWRTVSSDTFHTCAVDALGALFCWGRSIEGQLGNGSNAPDRLIPTASGTDKTWTSVSVGRFHTCAVATDQTIWCSGENASGQLGLGDTMRRAAWTNVVF